MQEDRFKFKAQVTLTYYNEEDEEKEVTFICEPNGIFKDGEIGIFGDDLYDLLNHLEFSEYEWNSLRNQLDNYEQSDNWYVLYPDFIIQCTGLRDKHDKLIYEGDIIREISKKEPEWEEYIVEVKWENGKFYLDRNDEFDFEIIGNIRDNPELLEIEYE